MHRIDTPTAQKDKFGQGKNGFTRGNPQTGTLATQMDSLYFDAIQEEIANVIESAGHVLNKEKHDQLVIAIKEIIKENQIEVADASTTQKGVAQLSSKTNSESETEAATPLAVKNTYDLAAEAKKIAERHAGYFTFGQVTLSSDIGRHEETVAATILAVARVNDQVVDIKNKFELCATESRIYSNNKKYYLFVRDDGVIAMYDKNNNKSAWGFNNVGTLCEDTVPVERILNIDQFVRDRCVPVGVPVPWPSVTPPDGWLICNGWKFDKSLYPGLAAAYPSGYLPEMRATTIRGLDAGRGIDVGRAILSEQGDAMRNLTGSFGFESNIGGNTGGADISGVFYSVPDPRKHVIGGTEVGNSLVKMDASRQVPTANEFRVRSIAFLYIVRAA